MFHRALSFQKGLTLFIIFFAGIFFQAYSQCGCTFTIPPGTGTYIFNGIQKGVKSGDVICISGGARDRIFFEDVIGAPDNYVIVKNCNGEARIGNLTLADAIVFTRSQYIKLTGTGDDAFQYGIKVIGNKSGQGVKVSGFSSDFEFDHLDIANVGFAGIMMKQDPSKDCADKDSERPNFTMYNVSIHDCYFHNIGGEGIYLGNSFYDGTSVYCGSTQYPHEVRHVRIFDNLFETTGWESIQVGSSVSDVEIYNNRIYNYGNANVMAQRGGIQMGKGTTGKMYNNFIKGGKGPALVIQGIGENYVFNNIVINPGAEAISVNTRPTPLSTDIVPNGYLGGVYLINNTIVGATSICIAEYINTAPGNVMFNNLIVASVSDWDKTKANYDWTKGNNVVIPLLSDAKFVNPALDDYRLQASSPAINAGRDVSLFGITFDHEKATRPSGAKWDAGAFEFDGNLNPSVTVIPNKTVLLPTSSTTLTGSATDADGSISSYLWTKISGPAGITLSNQTTATLSVKDFVAGTYVFRLTATDDDGGTGYAQSTLTVQDPSVNQAPVANAGADKTIILPTSSTTIKGSGSDADGSIVSYEWSQTSGAAATLVNATSATLTVTGLTAGNYIFSLVVRDNLNATSIPDQVLVTVSGNTQRVISFSLLNADTEQEIQMLSSGSVLNLADLPTMNLNIRANTNPVTVGSVRFGLSGAQVKNVTESEAPYALNGDINGNYNAMVLPVGSFTLVATPYTASGAGGDAGTSLTISFKVVNQATVNAVPTVNAGPDQTIILPTNSLALNGSATDSDGTIITHNWIQVSGPNSASFGSVTEPNPTVSGLIAGIYVFRLTVTDDADATAFDDVTITVNDLSVSQQVVSFTLVDATNEMDIRNLIPGETINLATLPSQSLNIRANTNPAIVGSIKFDLSGAQTRSQTEIASPYALFGDVNGNYNVWVPPLGNYSLKCTPFTGAEGSGTSGSPLLITFTVVNQAENLLPTANAGFDQVTILPASSVTLNGSGKDPDGTITDYNWTQMSGPNTAVFNFSDIADPTASGLIAGSYVFRLTVTDDAGATAFDDVTVTVNNQSINQRVVSFTLVNAANEVDIRDLISGETINLATLPSQSLNIRANTTPVTVGSVKFVLTGAKGRNQTEIAAPYALFGDINGNYNPWTPSLGSYSLVGTPYSASEGGGVAGTPLSVNFNIVNKPESLTSSSQGSESSIAIRPAINDEFGNSTIVFPNPAHKFINVKIQSGIPGSFTIKLYDQFGRLQMKDTFTPVSPDGDIHTIDLSEIYSGMHIIVVESEMNNYREVIKVLKN